MLIENLAWPEFEKQVKKNLAVIVPISPVEEHGPHLPLGTDFIRPLEFLKLASQKIEFLIYPVIPLGHCRATRGFPGTMSLKSETLKSVIQDIVTNLIDHKVKKIIIISGHGGKIHRMTIQDALYEIKNQHPKSRIFYLEMGYLMEQVPKGLIVTKNDAHAGEIETSEMLYLKPALVKKNKLVKGDWHYSKMEILTTKETTKQCNQYGVKGDATKATIEKGKILIESEIKKLMEIINN